MVRVIYIWKDWLDDVYWFSRIYEQPIPPVKGHRLVLIPDDVAPASGQVAVVDQEPYSWLIPECKIDYEVGITLKPGFGDSIHEWRAWLTDHGFVPIPRYNYFELFGVPQLEERWPMPPD